MHGHGARSELWDPSLNKEITTKPCQAHRVLKPHHAHDSGFNPIVRSWGFLEKQRNHKKEKNYWENYGFSMIDYSKVEDSGTPGVPGELEILLNNLLGVCSYSVQLADVLRGLGNEPGLRGFALTVDTVMKMSALYTRIDSGVPTVLMGESGCGKSAVVRYLAKFLGIADFVLDVHGGLTEDDIVKFVSDAVFLAKSDSKWKVWVFLDEINTASCVGLFRELVCDKSMRGCTLPSNLRVFAACNPYRKKSKCHETGGLELAPISDKLSCPLPIADLVYAVYPLPQSLIMSAWDFGMLSKTEEKRYVQAILKALPFQSLEERPMHCCMVSVVLWLLLTSYWF